jgi:hypothetical protein
MRGRRAACDCLGRCLLVSISRTHPRMLLGGCCTLPSLLLRTFFHDEFVYEMVRFEKTGKGDRSSSCVRGRQ